MRCWFQHPNCLARTHRNTTAAGEWRPTCVVPRLPSTLSRTHTRNANLDQVGVAVVCLYFLLTDLPRNVSFAVIRIGMAIRSKGQVDKAMLVLGPVGIVHRGG